MPVALSMTYEEHQHFSGKRCPCQTPTRRIWPLVPSACVIPSVSSDSACSARSSPSEPSRSWIRRMRRTTRWHSPKKLFESIGKGVVLVEETPGLFLGRVVASIVNEAVVAVHDEVASPEDVDVAMRLGPILRFSGRSRGGARSAARD